MGRLMISAMHSGSGKTVMTCALLRVISDRGISVESFKCGPDYIDPMFHRQVLGIPSRNLDLFLQGEEGMRSTLSRQKADFAVLEGAMGYYDGVNGSAEASAWAVARSTQTPVILLLRPKGISLTMAAQIRGMLDFRSPSQIAGVLLTDCKPMLYAHLKTILERETGVPVLGYLPPMEDAALESRHLGLITPSEVSDLQARFTRVAEQLSRTVDMEGLLDLGNMAPDISPSAYQVPKADCVIAVARDEAFCFYYDDNLDALREEGAELHFFSPLRDSPPLNVHGLYLGGGYPELYGQDLQRNEGIRAWIREAVKRGMPTVAECGGFLYLQQSLRSEDGSEHAMTGLLPGTGYPTGSLCRFGYLHLSGEEDSLLFRTGERIPAHEFHYWDTDSPGERLLAVKPSGKRWRCGIANASIYAGFPHLHFGGDTPLAARFVSAARRFAKEKL